jgi:hypothetical protein
LIPVIARLPECVRAIANFSVGYDPRNSRLDRFPGPPDHPWK